MLKCKPKWWLNLSNFFSQFYNHNSFLNERLPEAWFCCRNDLRGGVCVCVTHSSKNCHIYFYRSAKVGQLNRRATNIAKMRFILGGKGKNVPWTKPGKTKSHFSTAISKLIMQWSDCLCKDSQDWKQYSSEHIVQVKQIKLSLLLDILFISGLETQGTWRLPFLKRAGCILSRNLSIILWSGG